MTDYSRMTKAELLARLSAIEKRSAAAEPSGAVSTRNRIAEAALADSEKRLRAILDTAVEAIITIDELGQIESMNAAALRLFGYRSEEVIGRNVSLLMPSPYREQHDSYLRSYLQTGKAKIIGIGREVVARRKDGSTLPIDLAVSEVRLAERRLFTGFIRDISDRKRAEAALRREADLLHLSHDAIIVWRLDGGIESWNRGAEELYGFTEKEVLGRVSHELFETRFPEPWPAIEAALRTGNWTGELRHRTRDGRELIVSARLQLARGDDGVERVLETIHDVTQSKRAEDNLAALAQSLAEKNKELETIVYIASHDLRSPLVNIQGFSRELAHACNTLRTRLGGIETSDSSRAELNRLLSEDIPEALEFIQAGVTKIDTLLAGFLRYSRLGRAALKIEPVRMDSLVAGIVQAMEFQIKSSGAKLRIEPLPDCLGDATQMSQVFSNLLENAVKYQKPGSSGLVSVSGRRDGDRVTYAVRDSGIGIAREHQAKVFEIFHRLNPGAGEGEGLGLTIAQRILERQQGKIWLESKPGEGSTFFVSMPAPVQPT